MTAHSLPKQLMGLNRIARIEFDVCAAENFERIEFIDGLPVAADGTLEVANLLIPMASRESLGGYRADFFTDNDGSRPLNFWLAE